MKNENPTIAEITNAFSILAKASESIDASRLAALMIGEKPTTGLLKMLEFAGERATTLRREQWLEENAHRIVDSRAKI